MSQQAELTKEILLKEPAPTKAIPSISAWNLGRSGNDPLATSIVDGLEKDLGVKSQQRVNAVEGREQKPPLIEIKSLIEVNKQGSPLGNKFQEPEVGKRTQPSHKNDKYPDALSAKFRSQGSPPVADLKHFPRPKRGIYPGIRIA